MKQTQQKLQFGEVFLPQLALKLHHSPRIPGLSETQIEQELRDEIAGELGCTLVYHRGMHYCTRLGGSLLFHNG
jgi:hypothetical protein